MPILVHCYFPLTQSYKEAVYTRLDPWHYTRRTDGNPFDMGHFISHPEAYENSFLPYAARTDVYIASHYWDPKAPGMLTHEDLGMGNLPVSIIADISCDIRGPIASTLRHSSIEEPFYGYNPETGLETAPFLPEVVTVMAVDNLPGDLPRDSSMDFGGALMEHVIPELLGERNTGMLDRACITEKGQLTESFRYLHEYVETDY